VHGPPAQSCGSGTAWHRANAWVGCVDGKGRLRAYISWSPAQRRNPTNGSGSWVAAAGPRYGWVWVATVAAAVARAVVEVIGLFMA
jgi:hypothetical protein